MPVASKPMNTASTTLAATVRHTQRVAVLKRPNARRVPRSLLGASQSSGTPPSSGTQTPSQWPSPMMAASSTRSSLGPHEEPPALRFADAETASQSTTEAQPAKYVYRFDPYKWNPLKVAKGSDAVVLIKTQMPPVEVFDACGKTPQPSDYLPSCVERSHQELVDAARRMESVDSAFVHGVAKDGKASFVQGQSGYTATAEVHRGVFAVLAPEVPIALPTIHEVRVHGGGNTARTSRGGGHSAASQQHHQNGPVRRAHTGLLHSAAPRAAVDALVHGTHQRAYYGVGVVYTAHTPRAIRELAVFELVMAFYRNGVRTGRPFAPMTVELAKSEQIAKQMDARPF